MTGVYLGREWAEQGLACDLLSPDLRIKAACAELCLPLSSAVLVCLQALNEVVNKAPLEQRQLFKHLYSASQRYVKAVRLLRGTDLQYAKEAPSDAEVERARVTALALAPIHK